MRAHFYLFMGLLACFSNSTYAEIKPFTYDSLKQIERHYEGTPFVLVLWSADCPPCLKEFTILSSLQKDDAKFNLILINTDGLNEKASAKKILAEFSFQQADNWIFSESNIEKLRYHIDDRWAGDLPRAYFYTPDEERVVVSGLLAKETLEAWLAQ